MNNQEKGENWEHAILLWLFVKVADKCLVIAKDNILGNSSMYEMRISFGFMQKGQEMILDSAIITVMIVIKRVDMNMRLN